MNFKDLFKRFDESGKLFLPGGSVDFADISWSKHPVFEGVELKHLIMSKDTNGRFSYHLVKIAPNKSIGNHVHEKQLETHEVIAGRGVCINNGTRIEYEAGVISIFYMNLPHEIHAGAEGLFLFAKLIPALA